MAEREVTDFNTIDGSPNLQTLHREIDWLISDNIASVQGFGQSLNSVKHVSSLLNSSELYSVTLRLSIEELEHLWRKRTMERVPLQYLTHTAHWRDLELTVSDAVLIPRPETELLIDFAEEILNRLELQLDGTSTWNHLLSSPWLDLGTGSGALAIAMAQALQSRGRETVPLVLATDKSIEAVEVAKHNATTCGVQDVIQVLNGSWFEPIDDSIRFAGILSNPPYIPTELLGSLQPEVYLHEPRLALDGGVSGGLLHITSICAKITDFLLPGGLFAIETHGAEQAKFVGRLLEQTRAFDDIRTRADYAGVCRFVTARKQR